MYEIVVVKEKIVQLMMKSIVLYEMRQGAHKEQ